MQKQRPARPRWSHFKRRAPRWLRYWLARGSTYSLRGRFRRWLYEYELWVDTGAPCTEGGYHHNFVAGDRCEWCGVHVDLLAN